MSRETRAVAEAMAAAISAVVGIGFASGREAAAFFGRFGEAGLPGLVLAMTFVGLVAYASLRLTTATTDGPNGGLAVAIGRWAPVGGFILLTLTWATLAAVLAGAGACGQAAFGWAPAIGSGLAALGAETLGLCQDGRGRTRRGSPQGKVLASVLSGAILLTSLAAVTNYRHPMFDGAEDAAPVMARVARASVFPAMVGSSPTPFTSGVGPALVAAVLYGSFTSALCYGAVAGRGYGLSRIACMAAALGISGALAAMVAAMLHAMRVVPGAISLAVPMARVAQVASPRAAPGYIGVLFLAATSAASAQSETIGVRLMPHGPAGRWAALLLGWLAAQVGFTSLIATIYPAFGLVWLVVAGCLVAALHHDVA